MIDTFDALTDPPGRTRITTRALTVLITAVASDTLHVDAGDVGVALGDDHGLLAIRLDVRLPAAPLNPIARGASLVEHEGGSLLDRAERAETAIAERVASLTGLRIGHITMRITGIRAQHGRRVR